MYGNFIYIHMYGILQYGLHLNLYVDIHCKYIRTCWRNISNVRQQANVLLAINSLVTTRARLINIVIRTVMTPNLLGSNAFVAVYHQVLRQNFAHKKNRRFSYFNKKCKRLCRYTLRGTGSGVVF